MSTNQDIRTLTLLVDGATIATISMYKVVSTMRDKFLPVQHEVQQASDHSCSVACYVGLQLLQVLRDVGLLPDQHG